MMMIIAFLMAMALIVFHRIVVVIVNRTANIITTLRRPTMLRMMLIWHNHRTEEQPR